jgi:hypothetical protein
VSSDLTKVYDEYVKWSHTNRQRGESGTDHIRNFLRECNHLYTGEELIDFRDMNGQNNQWLYKEIPEMINNVLRDRLLKLWTEV